MLSESEREHIRRAYYLQKKSICRIAQEEGYSRDAVQRAISDAPSQAYHLSQPRPAPIPGPFHETIATLLEQNKHLPPKQCYTAHKIFELLQAEGYQGYERVSTIVTSNLRFGDWNSIFRDEKMTDAVIGRLTHKGHIPEFVGESYRFRYRLQQDEEGRAKSTTQASSV